MAVNRKVRHICGMSTEDPHFRLRVPQEVHRRIREAAAANNRSMNAEIIDRLQRTIAQDTAEGKFDPSYLEKVLREQREAQAKELQDMERRLLDQLEKTLMQSIAPKED